MSNNFFEWVKLGQRIIMVVLTIGLLLVMLRASGEIRDMRTELIRSRISIDSMKSEIGRLTNEINKGIKFRIW